MLCSQWSVLQHKTASSKLIPILHPASITTSVSLNFTNQINGETEQNGSRQIFPETNLKTKMELVVSFGTSKKEGKYQIFVHSLQKSQEPNVYPAIQPSKPQACTWALKGGPGSNCP